jgi:5-oxoprolinase (ATP-hydrolysing)
MARVYPFPGRLTIVFERRYPVILREFSLRAGSGGKGKYHGGDGVVRDIEFRIPCQVSILSERRVYRPYGLHGGEDAEFVLVYPGSL